MRIADYFNVPAEVLTGGDPKNKGIRIPVFGTVAAGIPIEAITDIEDYEEISEDLAA
jgi:repressor LexA